MFDPDSTVIFRRAPRSLQRRPVKEFAGRLRESVAGGRRFTCLVTDDRELQRLNGQFLGRDHATDVLSFPEPGGAPDSFLGEMAISAERAAEQARRYGHATETEVAVLMLHGLLHLLGMDHETDGGRMRRVEMRWRRKLELPAGLIERGRL